MYSSINQPVRRPGREVGTTDPHPHLKGTVSTLPLFATHMSDLSSVSEDVHKIHILGESS